jgi:hypothetical protein
MKMACRIVLLAGFGFGLMAWPPFAAAQACKDEQSMWEESKKDLTQLVSTVKQESVPDFEKAYHQKSVVNKLTFLGIAVQEVMTCLEKTQQDPAASKETVEACKAQHETFAKLKEKIQNDINTLKGLTDSKNAKAYAGKLDEVT